MNPDFEELSDGWVRCRSKSNPGRQYYFNRKTGKSSWTQPQPGEKSVIKAAKTKQPSKQSLQKRQGEGSRNRSAKRKSDGGEAGTSKKKQKNEILEKSNKKIIPKSVYTRAKPRSKTKSLTETPPKRLSLSGSTHTTTLTPNKESPSKVTPSKNVASKRLSQLRAELNAETKNQVDNTPTSKKTKIGSDSILNEISIKPRTELPSSNVSESVGSTTIKSPNSDSLHSIPSSSQFFAANKIICSMKAQLTEEYCNKPKAKDTFADIEQGICRQLTEYPIIKHPSTPPQFSEASKLVSAINSKLSYTPNIKTFTSAKDRMQALRASISGEIDERDLQDDFKNYSDLFQAPQSIVSMAADVPQKCEAMEVEDIKESNETSIPSFQLKDKDPDKGQVVLVVDTNIFIQELDFIKNVLNSHIKGYSELPMLLVPWRVVNELDRLKDNNNGNGALCKRARAAMDYLYKSLPENNRIKGQSLRDADSHIYPCELPDDEILNCALQQAERGRNVLLLSNDRNLCNKATINGVRRCGIGELKELMEHKPAPRADPDLLASFSYYQHTMYQLLANILENPTTTDQAGEYQVVAAEQLTYYIQGCSGLAHIFEFELTSPANVTLNEMRAKYKNLWLHVLFKAPPWSLADVLQCLLKHWIAVFNEVFPRIEHLITDLKNTHGAIESKDPNAITESDVINFKELCMDVAQKCQIIPEYMELAKLTVDRLARRSSETDDERARQIVVTAFEALWIVMSSYCAKLATALGVSHSVEDMIPDSDTLSNLTGKFLEFNHCIVSFVLTIKGVLNIEDTSSMDEKITRLEAAFRQCLQLARSEQRLTREDLRAFCLTNRNMLQEAVNKFSQLAQLLDACKNRLPRLNY